MYRTIDDVNIAALLGKLNGEASPQGDIDILLKINIVVVSSALVESVINTYIAMKSDAEVGFNKEERKSLFDKWEKGPCKYNSHYSLPTALSDQLRLLIQWRKNFLHDKPELLRNDIKILHGNRPDSILTSDLVRQFIQLPVLLSEVILKYDAEFKREHFDYKRLVFGKN